MSKLLNNNSKKILCVCRGGNSRSVGMAYTLKYCYGHDAIACGVEGNNKETVRLLCLWADIIITMRPEFNEKIPKIFQGKIRQIDVGYDRYFQPHADLIEQCGAWIDKYEDLKVK